MIVPDDSDQTWQLTGVEVTRKTFFGEKVSSSKSVRYIGHKILSSGRTAKKEETVYLGQDSVDYLG